MTPFAFRCPYCDSQQAITDAACHESGRVLSVMNAARGKPFMEWLAIVCSNPDCQELTLTIQVRAAQVIGGEWCPIGEPWVTRRLLPEASSKPLPSYIPAQLRDDYVEACQIRDLSPKAAATLARRCLQGMIRDFAKISVKSKKLFDEITALSEAVADGTAPQGVSAESIAALNAVRRIGNIGAHMEEDVNVVIDVEPGEAQILIELIEGLFRDWYIERHNRQQTFKKLLEIDADKQKQIAAAKAPAALPPP